MTDFRKPLGEAVFHTVAEVAAVLRVSRMTVYRMVRGGDLEAIRVGRSFRVEEETLREYIGKHVHGPAGR